MSPTAGSRGAGGTPAGCAVVACERPPGGGPSHAAGLSGGARRDGTCDARLYGWRTFVIPPCCRSLRGRAGRRFDCVQLLGLLAARQADLDQVERADEAVAEAEPAGASDRVAQRDGPVVLEQDQRGRRVVRDVLEDVPRLLVGEHVYAIAFRNSPGARLGAGLHALFALDPEADERADLAADLDRLVPSEVAQMRDLDLAVGVLVHRQRVDYAHRVAVAQTLELLDDLAMELRVIEAQHDELDRSDRHSRSFRLSATVSNPASVRCVTRFG